MAVGGVMRPHAQPTHSACGTGQDDESGACGSSARFSTIGFLGEARQVRSP